MQPAKAEEQFEISFDIDLGARPAPQIDTCRPSNPIVIEATATATASHDSEVKPTVQVAGRARHKSKAIRRPKKATTLSPLSSQGIPEPKYELLNVREVAAYLRVSVPTVWRWLRERDAFPRPYRHGSGTTRWDRADIDRFIAAFGAGAK